jgi:hypothetical protein
VFWVDIDRGRRNPERDALGSLSKLPSVRKVLGDLQKELEFDVLNQADEFAAAFTYSSTSEGPLALTATLHPAATLDLDRLRNRAVQPDITYLEDQSKTFFSYQAQDHGLAYWPANRRLLFTTGAWTEFPRKKIQGHPPTLANSHPEWTHFGTERNAVLRFTTHVPWSLRRTLQTLKQGSAPASIMRVTGEFAWTHPTRITVHLELSNSHDARDLRRDLEALRSDASKNPDLLYLGLGPHLESLRITQKEARISLLLSPTVTELGEFIDSLEARIRIP